MAEVDVLVIFTLGGGGIFFLFRDASVDPMLSARIHRGHGLSLFAGLLYASAHDAWGLPHRSAPESSRASTSSGSSCTARSNSRADLRRQAGRDQEICTCRPFAVHAPQPQMKVAVVRIEHGCFLAGGLRTIPVFELEVGATEEVRRFRVRRNGREAAIQFGNRIIDPAGRNHFPSRVRHAGRRRRKQHQQNEQNSIRVGDHRKLSFQNLTCVLSPIGLPFDELIATRSLAASP